jgi:hypothetical protein
MDLGISGRSAVVCGSSQGLGKSCALALAEAGASLVNNGRDRAKLERTADEIRQETKVAVTPVAADVGTHEGQASILSTRCLPRNGAVLVEPVRSDFCCGNQEAAYLPASIYFPMALAPGRGVRQD